MKVDFLIIGQGLAGSTLAIELLRRGRSVLVVDRQDTGSSTRVAAGLVTPLTGRGMNPAWRQEVYLPKAVAFYRELEQETGKQLYRQTPVVRLFTSEKERVKWLGKDEAVKAWALDRLEKDRVGGVDGPFRCDWGGVEMPEGAWLDTVGFIEVVKEKLVAGNAWREADFAEDQVVFEGGEKEEEGGERVCWQDVEAKKIILCQGAYGLTGVQGYDGWFGDVPHRSAKGEILSLKVAGLDETKRYHANGWLAPRDEGVWKAGATYDWKNFDSEPTEAGRREVLEKLGTWLLNGSASLEVVGHEAGVRPIIRNSRPLVGFHPELSQVGFFNGLGSKGSLMAPAVAGHFAAHLCGECELDEELALSGLKY